MSRHNNLHIIGPAQVLNSADDLINAVLLAAGLENRGPQMVRQIRDEVADRIKSLVQAVKRTETQSLPATYSPREVAQHLNITADKVLSWIHSGKLEAVDVSQEQSSRPRYRIDTESLARFKASRRSEPAVKVQRSQSKRNVDGVIQFF